MAYACSFRVTEAVYLVERIVDVLADELDMDPAELRLKNFIKPEQFPYANKTGWEYDSGEYERAMRLAMEIAGYDELLAEQREKRERGELMGIGISFFTETVGAGHLHGRGDQVVHERSADAPPTTARSAIRPPRTRTMPPSSRSAGTAT